MTSFQITLKPTKRAAGRFVYGVRRALQKALAEEKQKRNLTQTAVAKMIGVHRSVINRELVGKKDMTLGRVAELACALGRKAQITFPEIVTAAEHGANTIVVSPAQIITTSDAESDADTRGSIRMFDARAA